MRFAVHIPAWRRLALLDVVLCNLQRVRNHDIQVVVIGSEGYDSQRVAEARGAKYIECDNQPLGAKLNRGVQACADLRPDGIVGLGSDDLVTPCLFDKWAFYLSRRVDYMGVLDMFAYQLHGPMVYWSGYTHGRTGDTVGAGRCLSPRLLDELSWSPFGDGCRRWLDGSLTTKLATVQHRAVGIDMGGSALVDIKTPDSLSKMPVGERVKRPVRYLTMWFGAEIARRVAKVKP